MYVLRNTEFANRFYLGKVITYFVFVCVRACACGHVWVSLCACVCVTSRCGCKRAGVCLRACSVTNPVSKGLPYYFRPLLLHQIFSALSHKRHEFWKNFMEHRICVPVFFTTFV
jgi:hypothetical protein